MKKFQIKKKCVLLSTLIVVCMSGCGNKTASFIEAEDNVIAETQLTEDATIEEVLRTEREMLYVYVCGAVQNPGVYTLPEGSRICDVFDAAGGFTKEAATDYWNQARLLTDGEMLYVPTKEEAEDREASNGMSEDESRNTVVDNTSDKVNINTASLEELMTVPGIGEAKARAIIAYRQEHGAFSTVEEIKNVEGIKDGVFKKIKDYIDIN